jgi:hypothetical protein
MTRSSTVIHDDGGRCIAVWRDRDGIEHVVLGEIGGLFVELEAWIRATHGDHVVDVVQRDPSPPTAASGAGNTSCSADMGDEASYYPDPRDVFGTIEPKPAPKHTPRSVYLASLRASTLAKDDGVSSSTRT